MTIMESESAPALCKICGKPTEFVEEAEVLKQHAVKYFRCVDCGFVQTELPFWLAEAYSSAIGRQDTGILSRNLLNRTITTAVLALLGLEVHKSLDFGAGHGIFVRLMRDSGFEFSWYDAYATNDYAGGFDHLIGETYDFITAFEVLEHLIDPVADLSMMMSLSPNIFVSTTFLPQPMPKIADWWYYAPAGGQHVSFYTPEALRIIARRFGRYLLSNGSYHLFTTVPKSKWLFRLATSRRVSRIVHAIQARPSLIASDFLLMSKRASLRSPVENRGRPGPVYDR
jgi:hypothetical protein